MTRRLLSALGAALTVMFLGMGSASAEPYPAPPPPLTVSATEVGVGDPVTISGSGFIPGETVSTTVTYTPFGSALRGAGPLTAAMRLAPVNAVADANGTFTATLVMTELGTATLTSTGLTSGLTLVTYIGVGGPAFGAGPRPTDNPAYPTVAPTAGPTAVPAPPVNGGAGGGDNAAGDLPDTGAGMNIPAMIAIGGGVVLVGLLLSLFGARGAFARRPSTSLRAAR